MLTSLFFNLVSDEIRKPNHKTCKLIIWSLVLFLLAPVKAYTQDANNWLNAQELKKINWTEIDKLSNINKNWKLYEGDPNDAVGRIILRKTTNEKDFINIGGINFSIQLNKFKDSNIGEIALISTETSIATCDSLLEELNKLFKTKPSVANLSSLNNKTKYGSVDFDESNINIKSSWDIGKTRASLTCNIMKMDEKVIGRSSLLIISDQSKVKKIEMPTYIKCAGKTESVFNGKLETSLFPTTVYIIDPNREKLLQADKSILGNVTTFSKERIVLEIPTDKENSVKKHTFIVDRLANSFQIDLEASINGMKGTKKTTGDCKKIDLNDAF